MTCLIMLVVVLTGCSTFKVDKVKYYNEVLAKVGNENITRFDLVTAYNNYGYTNYVVQRGLSESEALNKTMETLIQRKLIVQYALDNSDKYALSHYEIKKLYRETLDYLLETFEENKNIARKIYGLDKAEDSQAEAEAKDTSKLSEYDYEKRVAIVDGQIVFKDTDTEKDEDDIKPSLAQSYITNFKSYTNYGKVRALLAQFMEEFYFNENDEDPEVYKKVCDKAIELACNNLINYEYYLREDGQRLSTNRQDLLIRFVERTYESQLESAYLTKVNNEYLKNEQLSNESITNAFKALYESDYAKYANDSEAYFEKIISTGSSNGTLIYYHPNSDAEFGYFLHVLLPFDDYVESELNWLKEHRQDRFGDDVEAYKSAQQALINKIMCDERTTYEVRDDETGELVQEEGVLLESKKSIIDVLSEYEQDVKDLNSFKEFMFRYSTDTATLTADMPYVIGYNPATYTGEKGDDDKLTGAYSTMVNNFTKEAIRLMQQNKSYTASNEYIMTNYGVHLLYYVAPVSNKINVEDLNKITVDKLDATILNEATGESYLDRVFDLVYPAGSDGMFTSNTKYSSYEQTLIESLYSQYPVTLYETKIQASTKV